MNKSLVVGALFGAAVATAAGGFAGYKMLSTPEYADVVAVTAVTERVETPREECHDQVVTRKKPVKDQHKITGTVIGAVAGGLLGDAIGGGGSNTAAKVAGAAAGGYAGNKTQQKMQENATYQTTERVCKTVVMSASVPSVTTCSTGSGRLPVKCAWTTTPATASRCRTASWSSRAARHRRAEAKKAGAP